MWYNQFNIFKLYLAKSQLKNGSKYQAETWPSFPSEYYDIEVLNCLESISIHIAFQKFLKKIIQRCPIAKFLGPTDEKIIGIYMMELRSQKVRHHVTTTIVFDGNGIFLSYFKKEWSNISTGPQISTYFQVPRICNSAHSHHDRKRKSVSSFKHPINRSLFIYH